jgi:hypothetical protein
MNCTNYNEQRKKKKEKRKKKTLKTYQSSNYNTSRSIRKILMRRIQRHHIKKITKDDRSESHFPSKDK